MFRIEWKFILLSILTYRNIYILIYKYYVEFSEFFFEFAFVLPYLMLVSCARASVDALFLVSHCTKPDVKQISISILILSVNNIRYHLYFKSTEKCFLLQVSAIWLPVLHCFYAQ